VASNITTTNIGQDARLETSAALARVHPSKSSSVSICVAAQSRLEKSSALTTKATPHDTRAWLTPPATSAQSCPSDAEMRVEPLAARTMTASHHGWLRPVTDPLAVCASDADSPMANPIPTPNAAGTAVGDSPVTRLTRAARQRLRPIVAPRIGPIRAALSTYAPDVRPIVVSSVDSAETSIGVASAVRKADTSPSAKVTLVTSAGVRTTETRSSTAGCLARSHDHGDRFGDRA
jgi:hypothetical protein